PGRARRPSRAGRIGRVLLRRAARRSGTVGRAPPTARQSPSGAHPEEIVKRRVRIWFLAVAALIGCAASEGGVTGTGVSAVSGNIVSISDQGTGSGTGALPFPIRVSIAEVPGIDSTTDADGTFQLSGDFARSLTLECPNANDGPPLGPLPREVPAGSQTVLENIQIDTAAPLAERVQPSAVRQFDITGRIDMVDCTDNDSGAVLITLSSRPNRQLL